MSVEITPSAQLGFHRPLTRLVTQTIKIHNPHPHPVAFKVKTTAPKQYCVRPNSGRVESGESVEVQVLLQPLAADPPPHAKCKDKFLVQSAFITPDEEMHTLGEMWAQTEATNKAAIQEQKIKCVYLAAEDGRAENGIREEEEEGMDSSKMMDESPGNTASPPKYSSPSQTPKKEKDYHPVLFRNGGHSHWKTAQLPYVPPQPKNIFAAAQSSPAPKANGSSGDRSVAPPMPATAVPPTVVTPFTAPTPAAPASTTEKSRLPDLTAESIGATGTGVSPTNSALEKSLDVGTTDKQKLEAALAEIERLKAQLKDESSGPHVTGLRRRGNAAAGQAKEGPEVMVDKAKEVLATSQGVPVEVVAALVVGVFVMTYLFF